MLVMADNDVGGAVRVLRRILAKEGENVPVNSLIAEMDAA